MEKNPGVSALERLIGQELCISRAPSLINDAALDLQCSEIAKRIEFFEDVYGRPPVLGVISSPDTHRVLADLNDQVSSAFYLKDFGSLIRVWSCADRLDIKIFVESMVAGGQEPCISEVSSLTTITRPQNIEDLGFDVAAHYCKRVDIDHQATTLKDFGQQLSAGDRGQFDALWSVFAKCYFIRGAKMQVITSPAIADRRYIFTESALGNRNGDCSLMAAFSQCDDISDVLRSIGPIAASYESIQSDPRSISAARSAVFEAFV